MRVRCPRCHRAASTEYPCKICGCDAHVPKEIPGTGLQGSVLVSGHAPTEPVSALGFKPGDLVRFNAHGLGQIGGLKTPEEVAAQQRGIRIVAIEHVETVPPCSMLWLEDPFYWDLTTDHDVEPA